MRSARRSAICPTSHSPRKRPATLSPALRSGILEIGQFAAGLAALEYNTVRSSAGRFTQIAPPWFTHRDVAIYPNPTSLRHVSFVYAANGRSRATGARAPSCAALGRGRDMCAALVAKEMKSVMESAATASDLEPTRPVTWAHVSAAGSTMNGAQRVLQNVEWESSVVQSSVSLVQPQMNLRKAAEELSLLT